MVRIGHATGEVLPIDLGLGPFDLVMPLARGGMGTVWRAVHRETGLPVAVKVVDDRADADLVRALEHEVRTVAGLDHPNVIRVFDQGRIDRTAARASGGELQEGSPWFAMELADAGELGWRDPPPWPATRRALLDLLDALGHAHANGVLHRDLKPANVLFASSPAGPVLKLSDFGMGWSWGPAGSPELPRTGGTPLYMAPEQFAGDLASQGPWTDLYALGCLAFALVTRRPPFPRGSFESLREAHLGRPFPGLPSRCRAPAGFAAFLDGLVAKAPGDRWSRAADAAAVLRALPEDAEVDEPTDPGIPVDEITLIGESCRCDAAPPPVPGPTRRTLPVASQPPDWRAPTRANTPVPPGVGLGLYGLRPIPLVDRDPERDLAWSLLASVADGHPRALLIEGASGNGKTRLAKWLCARAEETGAAVALRAAHGPDGGPRDGLPGLVARHLRVPPGLDRDALAAWVERASALEELGDDPALVLGCTPTPSVASGASGGSGAARPVTAAERYTLVERVVRRVARQRPAIVWIDDAQWGLDALAFATRLLDRDDLRVLVVVTLQEEALAERPEAATAIARVREHDRVTALRLGPLGEEPERELLRRVLGLEGELAGRIVERTRGNPLFAVQLVGDWVERGLLVAGAEGFRLATDDELALPASVAQLWDQRVTALVGDRGDTWRAALEVAAVLGPQIDRGEWEEACVAAGLEVPDDLVDRLVGRRLARVDPGARSRFGWVHEMLRESILAAAGPRVGGWHQACARMLAERGGSDERRGRHLIAAGAWREGVGPLLEAAQHRLRSGHPEIAAELARLVRAAIEPHLAAGDPVHVELLVVEALIHRMYGRLAEAKDAARRAVDHGRGAPLPLRIQALQELATLKLHTESASGPVFALLDEAEAAAAGLSVVAAAVRIQRGRAEEHYGDLAAAAASFRAGWELAGDDAEHLGLAETGLASIALKEHRLDDAGRHATAAKDRFEALGLRWHEEFCRLVLGEIARVRGEYSVAEACYREVIASYDRLVGRAQTALPRVDLALVLCATGRFPEAGRELDLALADASRGGFHHLVQMASAASAWVGAGLGDWDRFERALAGSRALLDQRLFDPDFAIAWQAAGDVAADAGERARAAEVWSLALAVWEKLGDPRADEVRRRLG